MVYVVRFDVFLKHISIRYTKKKEVVHLNKMTKIDKMFENIQL